MGKNSDRVENRNARGVEAMKLRMADLCSRSEQCEKDVRHKILRSGLGAEDAEKILSALREGKFIDESRFARAYARDKVRFSGWGRYKIRSGLMARRLKPSDIEEGLGAIDRKEYIEALKRAGIAKAKKLNLEEPGDARKFLAHMASRGFEGELAQKLLEAIRRKRREIEEEREKGERGES